MPLAVPVTVIVPLFVSVDSASMVAEKNQMPIAVALAPVAATSISAPASFNSVPPTMLAPPMVMPNASPLLSADVAVVVIVPVFVSVPDSERNPPPAPLEAAIRSALARAGPEPASAAIALIVPLLVMLDAVAMPELAQMPLALALGVAALAVAEPDAEIVPSFVTEYRSPPTKMPVAKLSDVKPLIVPLLVRFSSVDLSLLTPPLIVASALLVTFSAVRLFVKMPPLIAAPALFVTFRVPPDGFGNTVRTAIGKLVLLGRPPVNVPELMIVVMPVPEICIAGPSATMIDPTESIVAASTSVKQH